MSPDRRNDRLGPAIRDELVPGPHGTTSAGSVAADTIRVALIIELSLVRGALAALLANETDMSVIAGLSSGDRLLSSVLRHRPDVVVIDVDQGGSDMLEVVRSLHERQPECRVVVLVGSRRPGLVRRTLELPVAGVVDTDSQPQRLVTTIRQVARGKRAIDPALAVVAVAVAGSPLTPRELTVLDLAASGASPKEIAQQLYLTKGTVCNYLSRVITKLGARTRIDAIRIAREAGWI